MKIAPTFLLSFRAAGIAIAMLAALALARPAPAAAQGTMPDETGLARLVWKTMVTLDNANDTGNYAILQATGAPEFRRSQSPDKLAGLFVSLRQTDVDLSRTLTIAPTWYTEPAIDENGYLRLRGGFEFRPMAIRFDMLFRQTEGEWKLLGLSVVEMDANSPR